MRRVRVSGVCENCGAEMEYREPSDHLNYRKQPERLFVRFTCACGAEHRVSVYPTIRPGDRAEQARAEQDGMWGDGRENEKENER